ncbi:MAG TPA: hypothetical protein PKY59_09495 [Pyrinomonadaceae bacterium]|nr:hypothetical protein [Pyrinomonadaceae bacterium]
MNDLRIEHFKALKEEHRQYLFQVQQLWTYKLSTLGIIIAAAIFNDKIINVGIETKTIVALGIFSLPLICFLIDLKTLEVGLHVKLISEHLKENFKDVPEIQDWDDNLWSKNKFSFARTSLTIICALGVSFSTLLIAFLFVYTIKPEWLIYITIVSIISILIVAIVSKKYLPKLMESKEVEM